MKKINEVEANEIDIKPFKVKDKLNPDFFNDEGQLNSQIRIRLLDIADDFVKSLEVKWVKPSDIVLTGSIANYNWSKYSDVDIHIIYNFNDVYKKTEFVKDYFNSKRDIWNNTHEGLTIKGLPVEMSVEDTSNPAKSTGVYSLEKNKWVKEPEDMNDSNLNKEYIKDFCAKQMTKFDELFDEINNETDRKKLEILSKKVEALYEKLKNMRGEALKSKEKEMATGNIIWKVIKHQGYIEQAWEYINKVYDRRNTIDENKPGKIVRITEKQAKLINEVYDASKLAKFGPVKRYFHYLNLELPLKGEYELHENDPKDKQIVCKCLTAVGSPKLKTQIHDKYRSGCIFGADLVTYLGNYQNRNMLRNAIIKEKGDFNRTQEYSKIPSEDYTPAASNMDNFINISDVSELNEGVINEMVWEDKATADDVYNKYYTNIDRNLFNAAIAADPTAKPGYMGKYTKWILGLAKKGQWKPSDTPETRSSLERFAKIGNKLPKKDIQQYQSVAELYNAISQTQGTLKTRSEVKGGAKKVYEDEYWTVVIPETMEAAQLYGANTRWCTAAENDNMFEYYNKQGPLYIIISKSTGTKFQFHFQSEQYMDAEDEPISDFSVLSQFGRTDGLERFIKSVMIKKLDLKLFPGDIRLVQTMLDNGTDPYELFKYFGNYHEGLAVVELDNDKCNWIREVNRQLLSDKWYDYCDDFHEGLAVVRLDNGKCNWVRADNGQLFSDQEYDDCGNFHEGFAEVRLDNGKCNWVRADNGQLLNNQEYDWVEGFENGFAWVGCGKQINIVNSEGRLVYDQGFDNVYDFVNGFAQVRRDDTFNYINTEGRLISNQWFDYTDDFKNGFALVGLDDEDYYFSTEGWLYDYKTKQPIRYIGTKPQGEARMISEAAMPEFNLQTLSSIRSFAGKLKYCKQMLGPTFGSGSSRIIFEIDDNKVLKLAKNQKGLAQNEFEEETSRYGSIVVKVFECADDYSWLVEENCVPAKEKDFEQILGMPFETYCDLVKHSFNRYCRNGRQANTYTLSPIECDRLLDQLYEQDEYGFIPQLFNLMGDYQLPWGDLTRISTYGMVNRDGEAEIVIIDSGLSEEILNTYYRR